MDRDQIKTTVALILGSYPQLFSNTILVDPFFGSAVVHLPHPLALRLHLICGEAGYIHSCGKAIYVRKVVKSERNQLVDKVEAYIQQRERAHPNQTTFFSTYSHEHFTHDRHDKPESRHGLHDVKIDLAKFHLDNTPLFDVLSDLKTRLKERIHIPPGIEDYKTERSDFKGCPTANKQVTLWLLKDKSLPEDGGKFLYPGKDQYFVCYAQQYTNRNPFISFNERKPAWIAPTTLPHTLATAMLNLARPDLPRRKQQQALAEPKQELIRILDPFSGTCTTFLETLTLGLHMHFVASDNNPMSELLLKDNLHLFSRSWQELHEKRLELLQLLDAADKKYDTSTFRYPRQPTTRSKAPKQTSPIRDLIIWAIDAFTSECPDVWDGQMQAWRKLYSHPFSDEFIKCFDVGDDYFWTRILFYLVWRAVLTNLYKIGAHVEGIGGAIQLEMRSFCNDLDTLRKLKTVEMVQPPPPVQSENTSIGLYEGVYCSACAIPETVLLEEERKLGQHAIIGGDDGDVFKVLEDASRIYDLILTDPPYGFNTDEAAPALASLYTLALRKMVKALKKKGQLVLCLPSESFNGQSLSYFSTKRMVVRALLCAAQEEEREVRYPGGALPDPVELYKPPYYWRSEKALTRTVLHIRLE